MGSAKKWLCSTCNAELGIVTSENRLRFGQTEGSLPVRATCECGHTQWLNRYEDCTGPDTEMPVAYGTPEALDTIERANKLSEGLR